LSKEQCDKKFQDFMAEQHARLKDIQTISNLSEQIQELGKEIGDLTRRVDQTLAEAQQHEKEARTAADEVAAHDEQLKTFASLDNEIALEQAKRAAHRAGHQEYLTATGLAKELQNREVRLAASQKDEQAAREQLDFALVEEQAAAKAFDHEQLKLAAEDHQRKHDCLNGLKFTVAQIRKDLVQAEKRFEEWQKYSTEGALVAREIGRLRAAVDLTEAARRTLRDTAPEVARHICAHIAKRAQRMFNQINPEPIELEWNSDHYSLQVTPGDRRFAMLSGGEQTKLALAMTLAMIEEFSGLRFCVFDEPTYGVDAESRRKLADAILEAQKAAELEQLLLVSHDDAFEGKIENSVLLNKNLSSGTVPLPL
jgi:exonuclease SbcC